MTRDEIVNVLSAGKCKLVFNKVDGTPREMTCTLYSEFIPESMQPSSDSKVKFNPDIIRVFDLDKEGWRSFRVENFTEVAPV
jgi:hypothetical protein